MTRHCRNETACLLGTRAPDNATGAFALNEGDVEINPGLYQIPYEVLLPSEREADNLLVVGTPSATHVGLSTLRMEPQFMILGHAAGVVAALALQADVPVQRVDLVPPDAELELEVVRLVALALAVHDAHARVPGGSEGGLDNRLRALERMR